MIKRQPTGEKFETSLKELRLPMNEVVGAVLGYNEEGYNPFRFLPVCIGGVTGEDGANYVEVALDNPKSLEQRQYTICYDHSGANRTRRPDSIEAYDDDMIACLTQHPSFIGVDWRGSHSPFNSGIKSRSIEGCKKLEKILSKFALTGGAE